jgi:hypothetical protein
MSCTKTQEPEEYPILGEDPLMDIAVMEEESETLLAWAENGVEEAVLVHISPRDAMAAVNPETIQTLNQLIKDKNWKTLRDSRGQLYDNSNYMNAAVQLNMVKRIYWVIPYRLFEDMPLAGEKIKDLLKQSVSGFDEEEVDFMKMETGCLTGSLSGADMYICSLRSLPAVIEPVIISIDVSFFPVYATEAKISKLRALKWFFDYLTFRRTLRVKYASVSYNIESGYTDAVHRYIGEELLEGMGDPQTLKSESPSELWQFRDNAENMLSGGEGELVEEFLVEPLLKYPDDPALRLLNAFANARIKKYDESFKAMNNICQENKKYCYGFIQLGNAVEDKDWQNKFFKKALETLPDSKYVDKKVSPLLKTD